MPVNPFTDHVEPVLRGDLGDGSAGIGGVSCNVDFAGLVAVPGCVIGTGNFGGAG